MTSLVRSALALGAVATGLACGAQGNCPTIASPAPPAAELNTLTVAERAAGWRLLFDGSTKSGWRGYKSGDIPSEWRVEGGTLTKDRSTGDLISSDRFGDFELTFDWKLSEGGNAGVFYRGTEEYEHIYWSAPEYQLLDDENASGGNDRLTAAGAAYGLYPAPARVVAPACHWNTARIVAQGSRIEHWLNGQQLLGYELLSSDWEAKVKASKFKDWPNYGRAPSGHIGIQGDHGGALSLRNIKLRDLK